MNQVQEVQHWIRTAKQEKNTRNLANYIAYTLSECAEMIQAVMGEDDPLAYEMESLSRVFRSGNLDTQVEAANKTELMDAAFDTAWTALGTMYMLGNAQSAWEEGSHSNYSKFNHDGTASLTEDGKVIKGPKFHKPDFSKCVD